MLKNKLDELRQLQQKSPSRLKEASEDFEALFIHFMLKSMRKTVMKSGLLDTGFSGETMESLFDGELSKNIARNNHLGIAELLQEQIGSDFNLNRKNNSIETTKPKFVPAPSSRGVDKYFQNEIRNRLAPYGKSIQQAAKKFGIPANFIRAVIVGESSGNPKAISSQGAKGLMQLMDSTAREMGVADSFDPEQNVSGGAAYLAKMLKRFDGDKELALAAYNAGPNAVEKHSGIPPYKETQQYIRRVLRYYDQLEEK